MSAEDKDKATFLLRDVPGDVVREIGARAELNYRSRSAEILAILTAVCRGHVALPVSMDGATIAAIRPTEDASQDDGPIQPFEPESLPSDAFEKPYTQDVAAQEPAGGEA